MVVSFIWLALGIAFGVLGVWLLHKLLRPVLKGESGLGGVVIGAAPLTHFLLLLLAAQFGKDALLSAGIGDAVATLTAGVFLFIRGRKK